MRKLTAKDVTFSVAIEREEYVTVRGNAMASGDADADRELEDQIIAALDRGLDEAWCTIVVKATWTKGDDTFEGTDTLGCCSFLEPIEVDGERWSIQRQIEEHVKSHGMREQALEDLNADIKRQRAAARKLLRQTA